MLKLLLRWLGVAGVLAGGVAIAATFAIGGAGPVSKDGDTPALQGGMQPLSLVENEEYRYGADLFNAGFFWEAHEAWEGLWLAHGRKGPVARVVQALIKLAAAGVKIREGQPAGARTHTASWHVATAVALAMSMNPG